MRVRGVALIVALLAVALATILIAGLLDRGELALARTRNVLRARQATAYAQGLEAYAARMLVRDDAGMDAATDIWAAPLPPQAVPGGTIMASMRDLGGCFNLDNLVQPRDSAAQGGWRRVFARLLALQGLDPAIGDAVIDWLDADADPTGSGGAEDTVYLGQPVPYRAANRPFAHVSELRLVRGVDADAYARLAPVVCALPPGTRLNLNTAPVAVLQSLEDGISRAAAERLWQNGQANRSDLSAFLAELPDRGAGIDPALRAQLGFRSSYFLARGDIVLDDVPFTFFSLIERRIGSGIRVLERSRGADEALSTPALDRATDAAR
jgi:general secretion pathway protein K